MKSADGILVLAIVIFSIATGCDKKSKHDSSPSPAAVGDQTTSVISADAEPVEDSSPPEPVRQSTATKNKPDREADATHVESAAMAIPIPSPPAESQEAKSEQSPEAQAADFASLRRQLGQLSQSAVSLRSALMEANLSPSDEKAQPDQPGVQVP